jgi:HD-like signal output (HDOD) protein
MLIAERKLAVWRRALEPDPDLYELAALVATIPDTAATTVRFANSSYVGSVYPVGSVLDAVIRVGSRQVGAIAMASLNHELMSTLGVPELWDESLAAGRAAKMVGRLMGMPRRDSEHLFVAGLFSCAGAASLMMKDPGYLAWRARQWSRGVTDDQLMRREHMAYEIDHVQASVRQLDEWNFPGEIIAGVAAHHSPRTRFDIALWAGMTVLEPDSIARCHDEPFVAAMNEIGLGEHLRSVSVEALRFAEAFGGPEVDPALPEAALAARR